MSFYIENIFRKPICWGIAIDCNGKIRYLVAEEEEIGEMPISAGWEMYGWVADAPDGVVREAYWDRKEKRVIKVQNIK